MKLHDLEVTPSWEWPADAGRQLLATLHDEKTPEADRQLAAGLAGDLVVLTDELATALIGILENGRQPEEMRARAAVSLGPVLEQVDTDGFEAVLRRRLHFDRPRTSSGRRNRADGGLEPRPHTRLHRDRAGRVPRSGSDDVCTVRGGSRVSEQSVNVVLVIEIVGERRMEIDRPKTWILDEDLVELHTELMSTYQRRQRDPGTGDDWLAPSDTGIPCDVRICLLCCHPEVL